MKKDLVLPIKKKWFDMIIAGEKKEEYRKISPYWETRLGMKPGFQQPSGVEFRNGYGLTVPSAVFDIDDISKGLGNPAWGAPQEEVYIIKIKPARIPLHFF